jgi:hypothetical protein
MSKSLRFGAVALPLIILGWVASPLRAQDTPPPAPTPAAQTPPAAGMPVVVPSGPPPPKDPYILDDGGLYIEPLYWLNKQQPTLHAGATASGPADFSYGGNAKAGLGLEIGIPAGRANTLRVTYFRVQGYGNVTLANATTIFSEAYTAGEFINANYKLQTAKVSWDYLSYTWHKPSTAIRLKTLYEVQYVNTSINTAAPFVAATTDASGNTDYNTASGTKSTVLPTLGMAIGSDLGKFFRWDLRASGFGIPKHSAIGDVSGTFVVRLGPVEILAGEKFYYFKTSPKSDLFITDTLQGVYGGIRYAWRGKL